MNVQQIAKGLWRWTGLHPEWQPGDEWKQEVACVYYEAPDALCLIDPLIPPEDSERFFKALDADVERYGRPVTILLTVAWHRRSAEELAERYGGTIDNVPAGVESHRLDGWDETVYWLPEHRALVPGDALLGTDEGDVRVCPRLWVGDEGWEPFRASLERLLELPAERLLVSHGPPVLADGQAAIRRALRVGNDQPKGR